MTQKEFNAERRYQTAMIYVKKMLNEGVIDDKDYAEIDTKLLEKYRPTMSTLLSGKPLIMQPF